MDQDQPFFAGAEEEEKTLEMDGRKVVRTSTPESARPKISEEQRLYTKLMESQHWGDHPVVPEQDERYPATMKILSVCPRVFVADDNGVYRLKAGAGETLDDVMTSHYQSGKYRLVSEPRFEFSPQTGKWTAAVVYQVRQFKQLGAKAIEELDKEAEEAEDNSTSTDN